jgi:hypothetical protein
VIRVIRGKESSHYDFVTMILRSPSAVSVPMLGKTLAPPFQCLETNTKAAAPRPANQTIDLMDAMDNMDSTKPPPSDLWAALL